MTEHPLRARAARAIHRYDNHHALSGNDMPSAHHYGEADAVLAELKLELDALAKYENTITWHTTCTSCARVLDSAVRETERAEKAEAALTRFRDWLDAQVAKTEAADRATGEVAPELRISPHNGMAAGLRTALHGLDRLLAQRDQANGEQPNTAADALAAEWHRRHERLEELSQSKGPEAQAAIVQHLRGELIGLRGALGVLLGGQVEGGTADLLGWAYYQEWRRRQEAL
ncbi:hypothetical protein ACIP2X_38130 [Streptomyces sp. NPDC089424]|uniref:hypothetical protein n=1 Tax=Streptomyces sp. NPDC089424 TaxID=3365917 RepID=UPI00381E4819